MTELQSDVLETVTEENENQWNHVVEQSDLGTLFHRYEWLRACEESLDCEPHHVVVRKGDNPVGVFPNFRRPISVDDYSKWTERLPVKRLISTKPGAGGPAILTDEVACLERMFDAFEATTKSRDVFHTVRTIEQGYARYSTNFDVEGYEQRLTSCRFLLDLRPDWETIRDDMHKSRRQGLESAKDAGVEVHVPDLTGERMKETYRAYTSHMDRIGVDPFPPALFRKLYEIMDDRIVVFVATCEGDEVGRFLHLLDRERSTVNYYFAAIPSEEARDVHTAEALHGAAIQWAKDQDYDYYDFGETKADLDDGLFRFKSRFGGELVPSLTWEKGSSTVGWSAFKLARRLYKQ